MGRAVSAKHDTIKARQPRGQLAPVRLLVQLHRVRPAEADLRPLGAASATAFHLAKLLRSGGNVLLLDEPTNDLDVDTLRALEEALLAFGGCAVVITHDRWFLDRVATHMLAFEGDSQTVWFEGTYAEYEENRRARLGEDASQPRRITYKPLTARLTRRARSTRLPP